MPCGATIVPHLFQDKKPAKGTVPVFAGVFAVTSTQQRVEHLD
jgi:hypothetical protein